MGDHLWAVWLVIALVLAGFELASLDLVLIMLAVGALGGALTAGVGAPLVVQLVVTGGVSLAMLALVRPPVIRRLHQGPDLTWGHAKLVGTQGLVTEPMGPNEVGRVRLGGEVWSASPYDPTMSIGAGETIEVFEIRGATALVHPVPTLGA